MRGKTRRLHGDRCGRVRQKARGSPSRSCKHGPGPRGGAGGNRDNAGIFFHNRISAGRVPRARARPELAASLRRGRRRLLQLDFGRARSLLLALLQVLCEDVGAEGEALCLLDDLLVHVGRLGAEDDVARL